MQSKKKSVFKGLFWFLLLICGVRAYFALTPLYEYNNPYMGTTQLMREAEKNSDPSVIIDLVKAGEDVNARDNSGKTALMWAARRNPNPEVIITLLELGSDPKVYSDNGMMPIDYAKINKELENTEALRKLEEMTLMMLDINDAKDFFTICRYGSLRKVNDAIKAGADVNMGIKYGHGTPLMWAISDNSNPEVITALIEAGAHVNDIGPAGRTPLMFAAKKNTNPEVIITLLKYGADAKAKDNGGRSVMDIAKENKNLINTEAFRILEEASR
jgi:ankyrin repeat protein